MGKTAQERRLAKEQAQIARWKQLHAGRLVAGLSGLTMAYDNPATSVGYKALVDDMFEALRAFDVLLARVVRETRRADRTQAQLEKAQAELEQAQTDVAALAEVVSFGACPSCQRRVERGMVPRPLSSRTIRTERDYDICADPYHDALFAVGGDGRP
jgi:hypothetical protein